MNWLTKSHIKVGRIGCAWLIARFVDHQPTFVFSDNADEAEAFKRGAMLYHVDGSAYAREGTASSFEVLLQKANLTGNPALVLLGQIVGTADIKTSPHQRPEGAGLRAICDGLSWRYPDDDDQILREGFVVYDSLYQWCEKQVSLGRN
jgi:hypothetical protein